MSDPRIMFYHDGRHPLIYMYEPPMQVEEYRHAVDELAGTPVDALMFGVGDGRTVLYDTRAGELWGHHLERWPHAIWRRTHQNARSLIEAGHDPLRVVCDRAREKGMSIYPVLLVQMPSGERGGEATLNTRGSLFRFENKHLDIGASGDLDPGWPGYECADFKHEEIRDERFGLIDEILGNYPVDGLELNLVHHPYYFHPKEVDEGRGIMTEWVRRVHRAVKAGGVGRELVVQVPASVEEANAIGLDVEAWIEEGIVDALVGAETSSSHVLNPMADFRPLVDAANGSGVRVYAAIDSVVDTDRLASGTIEMERAAATNYWRQGVDGLYLGHWHERWPYTSDFYETLRELPHPDVMDYRDKIYFMPTESPRRAALSRVDEPGTQLPRVLGEGKAEAFVFTISDDLPRWAEAGRVHEVILRIMATSISEIDQLRFDLNGVTLPDDLLRKINQMYRLRSPRHRIFGYWFIFKLDIYHWPRKGENTLEVTLERRDTVLTMDAQVRDVELEIQYLMGRSFHRGFVDRDLGPYEFSS